MGKEIKNCYICNELVTSVNYGMYSSRFGHICDICLKRAKACLRQLTIEDCFDILRIGRKLLDYYENED